MPQTASNDVLKMLRATTSLLLLGTLLFAEQATAQFDYNSTLLGTVTTFINVSTIPGDWRSLTCTSHDCYCWVDSCGRLQHSRTCSRTCTHTCHIYIYSTSIQLASQLKYHEYELYCFLTFAYTARVTRHWASLGISCSRAADASVVYVDVHLKLRSSSMQQLIRAGD